MSGLKLSFAAASICTKPYKWVRTVTTSTTKPTVSPNPRGRRSGGTDEWGFSLSSLDVNMRRTLRFCAPFVSSAHVSCSPLCINNGSFTSRNGLGFPFWADRLHCACSSSFSSSSSSSSSEKGGSSSSGSGLVADMGQDNTVTADQNCFGHGHLHDGEDRLLHQSQSPARSPPQPQQQQQLSPKLLTLPTVLTLGRVAAVPLLAASRLILLP